MDKFSIINQIVAFTAAVIAIYVFIRSIAGNHKWAAIVTGVLLATISAGVFLYQPVVPVENVAKVPQGEAIEQPRDNGIEQKYSISFTNDTHRGFSPSTKTFTRLLYAKPGYKIMDYSWQPTSVNNQKEISIRIVDEGKALQFSAVLKAGPIFDRWRGWVKGNITTKEVAL